MKSINFFKKSATLIIAAISFAGYASTPDGVITMTTAKKSKVWIYLAGTCTATINWGYGSEPEKITLSTFIEQFTDAHWYARTFSDTTSRTIVIKGQNITHLGCTGLELIALDV